MRLGVLPDVLRRRWNSTLIKSLREAVADSAAQLALNAERVVGSRGFARSRTRRFRAAST
jgi:hypothetical protein